MSEKVKTTDIIMFARVNVKWKSQSAASIFLTLIICYKSRIHSWFC